MNTIAVTKKDKNERSRFLGDGVSYKAKLIGILEVSEARGDRMCQEALADLKMAIRAAGEHKQRININIAIDGLRLRDEKTGDCLYHHPVHKISFIAQDMSDSRAFGYIFGSPDTGHRFFGIKTDKAASQVVISMRDLFQVVFELKKKEIEMAKQHIEQHQMKFSSTVQLLTDSSENKASVEPIKMLPIAEDNGKEVASGAEGGEKQEQIMDLLDLQLELNNIQQGINQMERITPSDPFGPSSAAKTQPDPFGDSFNPLSAKAKLPPPPDTTKRSRTTEKHWFDQETEALFEETELPNKLSSLQPPTSQPVYSSSTLGNQSNLDEPVSKHSESPSTREQFDVFTELDPLGTGRSKPYIDKKDFFQELKNPPKKVLKDLVSEVPPEVKTVFQAGFVNESTVLAPQSNKIDNAVPTKSNIPPPVFPDPFQNDPFDKDPFSEVDFSNSVCFTPTCSSDPFEKFADFATFNPKSGDLSTLSETKVTKTSSVLVEEETKNVPLRVSLPPEKVTNSENMFLSPQLSRKYKLQKNNTVTGMIKLPSPKQKARSKMFNQTSVDSYGDQGSPIMEGVTLRNRISMHSQQIGNSCNDLVAPEPPPRTAFNSLAMKPPPLPPKRIPSTSIKPPPRPPQSDYDYIENYKSTNFSDINSPPIPAPARKPKVGQKASSEPEYYLQPFPLLPPPKKKNSASPKNSSSNESNASPSSNPQNCNKSLDITLSQLTKTGFSDLAASLNMSPTSLSKMTLQDLTRCLAYLSNDNKEESTSSKPNSSENKLDKSNILNSEQYLTLRESIEDETPTFPVEFEAHFNNSFPLKSQPEESLFDKYAVFRELLEQEKLQTDSPNEENSIVIEETNNVEESETVVAEGKHTFESPSTQPVEDRYAALRDICLDEALQDGDEADISDKEDSVVEPSRMEEDTDLLSQSRPHSESTDSPTLTMKEHQSIMETTIMEEDVSALDVDEDDVQEDDVQEDDVQDDDVQEENVEDTLQESSPQNLDINYEDSSLECQPNSKYGEKPLFSPTEELDISVEGKPASPTPVTSSMSWAKFDNGNGPILEKAPSLHSEGRLSPWSTESKDNDLSPACREQRSTISRKIKRRKQHLWQEDEESEDWDGRMEPSCCSPTWRENGWSDGDSLYDDTPPYIDRDYHSPHRGRRRRISPWNSRDPSPWEDDDRDMNEDQWESNRWQEEPMQRLKHRGPSWEDERKRHYEETRKARKPMTWSNEMDRKSSRESLSWEDEERYQKRNYTDRRRRKWEEELHNRSRGWRDRDWIEPSMKMNSRYYRERSHEPWDDEYSEHGEDDTGHWRPRSCERGRRQFSAHHHMEGDFPERRYIHSLSREEYCAEMDYRRKAHTLQSQKSRRKHGQGSPFEDDFTSNFTFPKDVKSPGSSSDVFESGTKPSPSQSESSKKCSFVDCTKKDSSSNLHTSTFPREGSSSKGSSSRSYQQSPFEDDFTPTDVRRCSGRSMASDGSDNKGSDETNAETKESIKPPKSEIRRPRSANQMDSKSVKILNASNRDVDSDSNGSRTRPSHLEQDNFDVRNPQHGVDMKQPNADFKSKVSNLKRTDSNTSLRKSESVNIFARNKDPFDDDFFCEDPSSVHHRKDKKSKSSNNESNKWTEAFNAFSFEEETN